MGDNLVVNCLFVCLICGLTSQSTDMVLSRWSVNRTTLFLGKLTLSRPPDKSAYWKIIFFISHPKHMLWVLN